MLIDGSIRRAIAVIEAAATQAPDAFTFISGKNSRDDSHIESWAHFFIIPQASIPFGIRREGGSMKKARPIDSSEPLLEKIFGNSPIAHYSDEQLHRIMQDLIDSDHRLLVELNLTAWHEAHLLRNGKGI